MAGAIGLAHRIAEPADRRGILDALRRLDAGAHVNGPGPQLQDAGDHISGMQPTRQNEPDAGTPAGTRDQSKTFPPPPIALDMGVEQQALGLARSGARSLANRSPAPCARRAGRAARQRVAVRRRLVAVELQHAARGMAATARSIVGRRRR